MLFILAEGPAVYPGMESRTMGPALVPARSVCLAPFGNDQNQNHDAADAFELCTIS